MRVFKINFAVGAAVSGVIFGFIHLGSSNEAIAQKLDKTNKAAWASVCLKTKAGKLLGCRLVQRVFIKNRGKKSLLLSVQLRRPKGGMPYVHMQLPLGLSLPGGVVLAVMGDKNKKPRASYRPVLKTCLAHGCLANLPLDKKLLAIMKRSKSMRVLFKNNNNKTINVGLSLMGMSKAYDQLNSKLK